MTPVMQSMPTLKNITVAGGYFSLNIPLDCVMRLHKQLLLAGSLGPSESN